MVNYTIHVPDELYDLIKQAAAPAERSIHGEILWLLRWGLAADPEASKALRPVPEGKRAQ